MESAAHCAQQARDPGFHMLLVLHVFAKPLFCIVVVMMCNIPESVHFALAPFSPLRAAARPLRRLACTKDTRKEAEQLPHAYSRWSEQCQGPRRLLLPLSRHVA